LTGQKQIADVARETGLAGLKFIGTGPLPPNPSALLSGDSLPTLLAELCEQFDLVVIDAPPVLGLADAPRLSSVVDATVFVVEANGARMRMLQRAIQRLTASHAQIAGAVMTKYASALRKDSLYNYDYGYSSKEEKEDLPAGASFNPLAAVAKELEPAN
jgi:Mrp family chromosome partitioning ATPase